MGLPFCVLIHIDVKYLITQISEPFYLWERIILDVNLIVMGQICYYSIYLLESKGGLFVASSFQANQESSFLHIRLVIG